MLKNWGVSILLLSTSSNQVGVRYCVQSNTTPWSGRSERRRRAAMHWLICRSTATPFPPLARRKRSSNMKSNKYRRIDYLDMLISNISICYVLSPNKISYSDPFTHFYNSPCSASSNLKRQDFCQLSQKNTQPLPKIRLSQRSMYGFSLTAPSLFPLFKPFFLSP